MKKFAEDVRLLNGSVWLLSQAQFDAHRPGHSVLNSSCTVHHLDRRKHCPIHLESICGEFVGTFVTINHCDKDPVNLS